MASGINIEIKITDGADLEQALLSLEPKVGQRVVSGPLNKYGRLVLQMAESLAPEDTGELVQSLRKRKMRQQLGSYGIAIGTSKKRISGAFHPSFVELGHTHTGGVEVSRTSF